MSSCSTLVCALVEFQLVLNLLSEVEIQMIWRDVTASGAMPLSGAAPPLTHTQRVVADDVRGPDGLAHCRPLQRGQPLAVDWQQGLPNPAPQRQGEVAPAIPLC